MENAGVIAYPYAFVFKCISIDGSCDSFHPVSLTFLDQLRGSSEV